MAKMTVSEAIKHAYHLYDEWIGPRKLGQVGFDFDRIRRSMLQELRYDQTRGDRVGVVREIKGELVLLGKVRKVLASSARSNPSPASLLPSTWKPCSVRRLPSGKVQVKITRGRGR
jgi:hypothetical protein